MTPRGCFGKVAYATRDEANRARSKLIQRGDQFRGLNAYHCRHCAGFHLGRNKRDSKVQRLKIHDHYANSARRLASRYFAMTSDD